MKQKNNWETLFTTGGTNIITTVRTFPIANITAKRWRLFQNHHVSTGFLIFS